MGLPGVIHVKITTSFDEKANSASRTIQYLGGWGLNCLSACTLGSGEFWDIDRHIMEDTIELPDGTYTLDKKHVGPGQFDYKWSPTEDADD
jgi:hypothetical protein